jgi:cytochrome d ubiquinol oxidase subunit I
MFMVHDWAKAIFNPNFLLAFPHMWIAALELSLFFVAGVSAWFLLKNRNTQIFLRSLKYSLLALVIIAPLQVYLGDALGLAVADDQPAALAAMEGHYHTYNPDGSPNTGWHVLAWPNDAEGRNDFAITLPHVLSLIETRTLNGVVKGLDQFKPEDRPPVLIPFYAFRIMVAIGIFLSVVALWGLYLKLRGHLNVDRLRRRPLFLRTVVFSAFLPYLAIWTGWWTREIARQPWIVHGLMRTSEGASQMSVAAELAWLIGFGIFEIGVWIGAWYFFAKVVRQGPDLESPVIDGQRHDRLGHMVSGEADDEYPEYARPTY